MSKYYGQDQTDRVIESYFDGLTAGTCVEVGAYDGIANSNTYYFEQEKGFKCVCIEANPRIFPILIANRIGPCYNVGCSNYIGNADLTVYFFPGDKESALTSLATDPRLIQQYAEVIQGTSVVNITVNTLDHVLICANVTSLDFVSIDTEGTELDVLRGFDVTKWRPKLLVIEENYVENTIRNYLKDFGYVYDGRNGVNNFYVRNDI